MSSKKTIFAFCSFQLLVANCQPAISSAMSGDENILDMRVKAQRMPSDKLLAHRQVAESNLLKQVNDLIVSTVAPGVLGNGPDQISKQYIIQYFGLETLEDIKKFEYNQGSSLTDIIKSAHYKEIFDDHFIKARQDIIQNRAATEFSLFGRNLKALPLEVSEMNHLEHLDLSNNFLTHIHKNLASLTMIKSLNLSLNRLSRVPDAVLSLKKLRTLKLDSNHLEGLPVNLGDLVKLERLYLGGNHLEALPRSLLNLGKTLKILDLSSNHFDFNTPDGAHGLLEIKYHLKGIYLYIENQTAAAHMISARKLKMDYTRAREVNYGISFAAKQNEIEMLKQEMQKDKERRIQIQKKLLKNLKLQMEIEQVENPPHAAELVKDIQRLRGQLNQEITNLKEQSTHR